MPSTTINQSIDFNFHVFTIGDKSANCISGSTILASNVRNDEDLL